MLRSIGRGSKRGGNDRHPFPARTVQRRGEALPLPAAAEDDRNDEGKRPAPLQNLERHRQQVRQAVEPPHRRVAQPLAGCLRRHDEGQEPGPCQHDGVDNRMKGRHDPRHGNRASTFQRRDRGVVARMRWMPRFQSEAQHQAVSAAERVAETAWVPRSWSLNGLSGRRKAPRRAVRVRRGEGRA